MAIQYIYRAIVTLVLPTNIGERADNKHNKWSDNIKHLELCCLRSMTSVVL